MHLFIIFSILIPVLAMTEMEKQGVIPDVIDKLPEDKLEVKYPNNVIVDNGKVLTPTKVKDEPMVKWPARDGVSYLLVMVDPDAPSRAQPKFREWNHWLVGNILMNDVSKGEVLAEYIGAGPPKGTDKHRYVFLVYIQPMKLNFEETKLTNTSSEGRGGFNIRKFAKKYKLGHPIAGNFFLAEYDDYVPTLYKQLGAQKKKK